jgi:hypothetical protein
VWLRLLCPALDISFSSLQKNVLSLAFIKKTFEVIFPALIIPAATGRGHHFPNISVIVRPVCLSVFKPIDSHF